MSGPGKMTPRASVILLTLNEGTNIGDCLAAVGRQDYAQPFEIVLIDSGSTDGTIEIARGQVDQLLHIARNEFHHARTRNLGASMARGEFLVYLAADALPVDSGWLRYLLSHFSDERVGAVYGRQIPRAEASIERRMLFEHRYPSCEAVRSGGSPRLGNPNQEYHFSTVNAALRKSIWKESPFPEICKTYEDVGMAKQLLDRGWKIVYEPRAAVIHSHNYSLIAGLQRAFDTGVIYDWLGLWDRSTKAAFRKDGTRRALRELRTAWSRGETLGAAYLALYDVARYAGVYLGRNEKKLPRALKRQLSYAHLFD